MMKEMKYIFKSVSNRYRNSLKVRLLSCICYLQSSEAIVTARQFDNFAAGRTQEFVELNSIGVGVTFKKEGQRRFA